MWKSFKFNICFELEVCVLHVRTIKGKQLLIKERFPKKKGLY